MSLILEYKLSGERMKLILLAMFCISLSGVNLQAEEYDPRTNPAPPVRPIDKPGLDLIFPKAFVTTMLTGEDTNGEFTGAVEHIRPGYYGPPHLHYEKSETLIMMEGTIHVRVSDEDYVLTEGQWLYIPPGNVHSVKSAGTTAKFILLYSPAGTLPTSSSGANDECDRSSLTDENFADPPFMIDWYQKCTPDFHMVPEAGYPFDPPVTE
ncbi:MAG: cupin domain-containing protein [Pseudomonadota bacterium]